jgi:hypothetical protein
VLRVCTGRSTSHGVADQPRPAQTSPDPTRPGTVPAPTGPYANASATDATNASTMPIHCCAVNRSRSTIPASTTVPIG